MEFFDFQLRAWTENDHQISVLVHSSPVGDRKQPIKVDIDLAALRKARQCFIGHIATTEELVKLGRQRFSITPCMPFSSLSRVRISKSTYVFQAEQ